MDRKRPVADVRTLLHERGVHKLTDIRLLWVIGAFTLVSCSIGVLLVGSTVALPLVFGATALGHPIDVAMKWLFYISPLWLPIGVGMGIAVAAKPVRWLRSKDAPETADT